MRSLGKLATLAACKATSRRLGSTSMIFAPVLSIWYLVSAPWLGFADQKCLSLTINTIGGVAAAEHMAVSSDAEVSNRDEDMVGG